MRAQFIPAPLPQHPIGAVHRPESRSQHGPLRYARRQQLPVFLQFQFFDLTGANRVSASRLQHISDILRVPVPFFFEGAPHVPGQIQSKGAAPSPAYVTEFLASSDGPALTKAFTRIQEPELRRRIVRLVEEIAGDDET